MTERPRAFASPESLRPTSIIPGILGVAFIGEAPMPRSGFKNPPSLSHCLPLPACAALRAARSASERAAGPPRGGLAAPAAPFPLAGRKRGAIEIRRMRVLFMAYDWPDYRGGPIVAARRLLPEWVRRGHEVYALLFYHREYADAAPFLRSAGVVVSDHPFPRTTEAQMRLVWEVFRKVRPTVFIPNLSVSGCFAARWIRRAGIPTIGCYWSDDSFYRDFGAQFLGRDRRWALSAMAAVSRIHAEELAGKGPTGTKVRWIPSGLGSLKDHPRKGTQPFRHLVYVGRLQREQKRIVETIAAFHRVLEALPHLEVSLVGGIPNREEEAAVSAAIRAGPHGRRIHLRGTVPPEEIQGVLRSFDALVLLSDYEGTPGAVMEGMAAGLVPVCLDIGRGVAELVRHEESGLLVPDREEGFVAAIRRLAEDAPLRRKLAAGARQQVERYYSLPVVADRWESLWEECLRDAPRARPFRTPRRIRLPPVLPGLAREDRREPRIALRNRVLHRLAREWRRLARRAGRSERP